MRTLSRLVLGMLIMVLAASCNGEARQRELRASRADSVIFDIGTTKDYERMRALADSDAKALKEQSMHDQAARRYEEGLEAIKAGIAEVWEFVNSIVEFNRYTNSPIANYKGKQYNMPFNMNTFYQMWGVLTPEEARQKIEEQKAEAVAAMKAAGVTEPRNLEEQALMLIGKDIYEALIKGYTEKQWGRKCTELPAFIIKRLPVRFVHDNNYFNDKYQGIPIGGYNKLIDGLLEGVETRTDIDFFKSHTDLTDPTDDAKGQMDLTDGRPLCDCWQKIAEKLVYTGAIDEYFGYRLGKLEWRTVSFEEEVLDTPNYQGNAVMNYTEAEVPYTRIIEHKHFELFGQEVYDCPKTVISREYSTEYKEGMEPYYTVNDERNNALADQYRALAAKEQNVIFGGRLAEYRYYDI